MNAASFIDSLIKASKNKDDNEIIDILRDAKRAEIKGWELASSKVPELLKTIRKDTNSTEVKDLIKDRMKYWGETINPPQPIKDNRPIDPSLYIDVTTPRMTKSELSKHCASHLSDALRLGLSRVTPSQEKVDSVYSCDLIADIIEDAMTKKFLSGSNKGSEDYKHFYRLLKASIEDKNNESLVLSLLTGSITPAAVVDMDWKELTSSTKRAIVMKIMNDNMKLANQDEIDSRNKSVSTMFTCRKCKNNKCSYYQVQTRSADEPMTTFIECLTCGNRWKE